MMSPGDLPSQVHPPAEKCTRSRVQRTAEHSVERRDTQVSLQKHPPTNNEINGTFIFIGLLSLLLTEEDKDDQKDCNSLHSGSRHPGQASYQDAVTLYSYVPPAAAYQEDQ